MESSALLAKVNYKKVKESGIVAQRNSPVLSQPMFLIWPHSSIWNKWKNHMNPEWLTQQLRRLSGRGVDHSVLCRWHREAYIGFMYESWLFGELDKHRDDSPCSAAISPEFNKLKAADRATMLALVCLLWFINKLTAGICSFTFHSTYINAVLYHHAWTPSVNCHVLEFDAQVFMFLC